MDINTYRDTDVDMDSYPAKMVPTSAMNHSAELKPRIPTPWQRCNPSCRETGVCRVSPPQRDLQMRRLTHLEEGLGGGAAGLVVLPVAQAAPLLPVPPAQGRVSSKTLHGGGEHLVDGQRRCGLQARVSHPQPDLCVSLGGPQGGLPGRRHGQRAWPLSFFYRTGNKRKTFRRSNEGWNYSWREKRVEPLG